MPDARRKLVLTAVVDTPHDIATVLSRCSEIAAHILIATGVRLGRPLAASQYQICCDDDKKGDRLLLKFSSPVDWVIEGRWRDPDSPQHMDFTVPEDTPCHQLSPVTTYLCTEERAIGPPPRPQPPPEPPARPYRSILLE